jgi:transposase
VKETETQPEDAEDGTVLGVDLNVGGHLAVTSTGAFIGNADYLDHKCREYEKRRGQIQQEGTRSVHLTMKSLGRRFARWSKEYTEYKAVEYGIGVENIAPQYTSHRCSHVDCSFTHEDNRDGEEFCCLKCCREYHAAKNIARKRLQNWHKSGFAGATSHLALKSGTVNVNGIYTPTTA